MSKPRNPIKRIALWILRREIASMGRFLNESERIALTYAQRLDTVVARTPAGHKRRHAWEQEARQALGALLALFAPVWNQDAGSPGRESVLATSSGGNADHGGRLKETP